MKMKKEIIENGQTIIHINYTKKDIEQMKEQDKKNKKLMPKLPDVPHDDIQSQN